MQLSAGDFTIGTLSKRTGVKVETIRYYERAGLLPGPPRTAGGHRLQGREHLRRPGPVDGGYDCGEFRAWARRAVISGP